MDPFNSINVQDLFNLEASKVSKEAETKRSVEEIGKKIIQFTSFAWILVWVGVGITVIGFFHFIYKNDDNGFALNLLGDFLAGSTASAWSLSGLFFIYVAFLSQKQQLLNQELEIFYGQIEVKHARYQLQEQRASAIEQSLSLKLGSFERTFFQLVDNHQKIVNAIDIRRKGVNSGVTIYQGRDCFVFFYKRFKKEFLKQKPDDSIDNVLKAYSEFYSKNQADLGHYFRYIYHILKYIKNTKDIPDEKKFTYTSLLRALLSSYEIALLFYNGLSEYGNEFFKPLLEEYSFLKNLDDRLLINSSHKIKYSPKAFAGFNDRSQEV